MKSSDVKYLAVMMFVLGTLFLLPACNRSRNTEEMAGPGEYYTCSMDPQVMENKPGNCPICHMKLIKAKRSELKPGQIKLSAQQIKLANIMWDTLRVQEMAKEIVLTGRTVVNQNFADAISARARGRIEKLYVKNIGDFIKKGQPLYELYSEDLNAAQQEYIIALRSLGSLNINKSTDEQFIAAAENKLLVYGMTESQIRQIKKIGQILRKVTVYASASGFVDNISIAEGSYITEGATLFRLSSINSLWVEAQVYLPYLSYLSIGSEARISIPAAGEKVFAGRVTFIDPQAQAPARFVPVRFEIIQASQELKPGMMANIVLQTGKKRTLSLPIDAVIQSSNGSDVWVRNPDGSFENKMVVTGMQNSRRIEIVEGLKEGALVVTNGAYLLNSEYVFKRGSRPMEGHAMEGMKM